MQAKISPRVQHPQEISNKKTLPTGLLFDIHIQDSAYSEDIFIGGYQSRLVLLHGTRGGFTVDLDATFSIALSVDVQNLQANLLCITVGY
jgi:hypothetical protein